MKKLKIVTIGIPVFNEEKNICKLLDSLTIQKTSGFLIKEFVIMSDGCTDKTIFLINAYLSNNEKIILHVGNKRLGKPARINQLFRRIDSDIVVILDGDVVLKSKFVISRLVNPLLKNNDIVLTSGLAMYFRPKKYFEKIMSIGLETWDLTKKNTANAQMYTCEGQIRAFSKKLYKTIRFPQFSADDVYPYLYVKSHGMGYKFVSNAIIYYGLPSNIKDYIKQHVRYLRSKNIQLRTFDSEFVQSQFVIGIWPKVKAVIRTMRSFPVEMFLYLCLLLIPKILVNFGSFGANAKWSIVDSTKKII